jgi:hypothetical protein
VVHSGSPCLEPSLLRLVRTVYVPFLPQLYGLRESRNNDDMKIHVTSANCWQYQLQDDAARLIEDLDDLDGSHSTQSAL